MYFITLYLVYLRPYEQEQNTLLLSNAERPLLFLIQLLFGIFESYRLIKMNSKIKWTPRLPYVTSFDLRWYSCFKSYLTYIYYNNAERKKRFFGINCFLYLPIQHMFVIHISLHISRYPCD